MSLRNVNKFIIISINIIIISCSSYKHKGMEIIGDGRDCFNNENIRYLIDSHFKPEDKPTRYLAIRPNITNSSKCIGLYNCVFTGLNSNEVVLKVLKFEDKAYMFDEDNIEENEKVLNEFIVENKHFFTENDLEKLIAYFKKGTEYRGSFF